VAIGALNVHMYIYEICICDSGMYIYILVVCSTHHYHIYIHTTITYIYIFNTPLSHIYTFQGTFVSHRPAECVNGLCAPRVAVVRNRSASRF